MTTLGLPGAAQIAYWIGNSLVEDIYMAGLRLLATDNHRDIISGYHRDDNQSLETIVSSPGAFTAVSPGPWNTALPMPGRRFLTFQVTVTDGVSTMGGLESSIATFIAAAPSGEDRRHFLYEGWPIVTVAQDYQERWNQAIVDSPSTLTIRRKQFTAYLFDDLTPPFFLVPTGNVLEQVDIAARAGNLSGVTKARDLYRDDTHAGQCMRFLSAVTHFCVFFRQKPTVSAATVTAFAGTGGGSVTLTEALAAALIDIAWATVIADSRTGVHV